MPSTRLASTSVSPPIKSRRTMKLLPAPSVSIWYLIASSCPFTLLLPAPPSIASRLATKATDCALQSSASNPLRGTVTIVPAVFV